MHPQGWTGRGTGCLCRTGASAGGGITRRERFLSVLRRPIGSAAGVPGAKPPAKQTKNLPLPRRGRGGGWGKKRKVKAGAAGGKAGKPPSGFRKGIVIRRPPGQTPRRVPQWKGQPMPLPAQPRGCKGRSPLHKKTKKSPPSPEGKGRGMGEKEKGQGGGGGRQSRQAPQRIPERHSHPATTRANSPQGATVERSANAASGSAPGMQGAKPLA